MLGYSYYYNYLTYEGENKKKNDNYLSYEGEEENWDCWTFEEIINGGVIFGIPAILCTWGLGSMIYYINTSL